VLSESPMLLAGESLTVFSERQRVSSMRSDSESSSEAELQTLAHTQNQPDITAPGFCVSCDICGAQVTGGGSVCRECAQLMKPEGDRDE
jgi:hypothetical protein